ncbi:glycoside hydrolase family 5 protein [Actinoallomurus rhizosphaericola]|uniref:glycoside hydrolase family 5 protein n=1 Tax=Actinoallomurus rhizosphaericola TaxID=2952536 RepID=UPI00209247A1|nr:cellulase family glycosylhydrolase [Actinoallomurus rhizosphaericola]MCO5998097.1 glycoside hydrolase family 5 protein [Actinoallomurus rhizosphaericola]
MSIANPPSFLRVNGSAITDATGRPVRLYGIGLAGWLNMENWITGYPGHENGMLTAVRNVLGPDLAAVFLDRFLEHFFTADDAAYLASLGINVVRIPFHYKYLESDDAPFQLRDDAFTHLDRAVRLCAEHGIRTILDLHTVPGWQNQDWHCDNPTNTAQFWRHPHFQDRVLNLWKAIAAHYRDEPWVAGYNPLNEPADPTGERVLPFYRRLVETIREIDDRHIIFLDGNRYAVDFHIFEETWPNVIYSPHDYPPPGHTPGSRYPGRINLVHVVAPEEGKSAEVEPAIQYWDKDAVERGFLGRVEFPRRTGTPIVVGEFNAVFPGDPETDRMRLNLIGDQLDVFRRHGAHWIYWSYKDVGLAAPLTLDPDSPWMRRVRPIMEKKDRLAVDLWGGLLDNIAPVLDPIRDVFAKEFPDYCPFPWGAQFAINRLVPNILFAEAMIPEFAELFRGMDEQEIDDMMRSFRLENCRPREQLVATLRDAIAATEAAVQPSPAAPSLAAPTTVR